MAIRTGWKEKWTESNPKGHLQMSHLALFPVLSDEWEGIVVYGCVREVDELEEMSVGIQALASIPVGAVSLGIGEIDVAVNFGGVTFLPEDYLYADNTGVILSPEPLNVDLDVEDDEPEEI